MVAVEDSRAFYRNKEMDSGKGYSKKLFELFIEQAKKEGFHSLKIETHEGNAIMRHLIELYGFDFYGRVILD